MSERKKYFGCGCEVIDHFPDFCPFCLIEDLQDAKESNEGTIAGLQQRIAELEANIRAIEKVSDFNADQATAMRAKLDAVQPLPDKWRKYTFDNPEATSYIDSADCADELEEALGEVK